MMTARTRSIRLNVLLVMYRNGTKDYATLFKKCQSWGVTKQTAKSYLDSLEALISKHGEHFL